MHNKNDYFLEDNLVGLRSVLLSDVEGNYSKWLNDPSINFFNSHCRFPIGIDDLKMYVLNKISSKNDIFLAIIDKESGEHIGNIILQNINWIDRNAEIAFLLGEKKFWSKGFMFSAGSLLINHAFMELNIHRIYLGTSVKNIGMQKLAIKLGFEKEGERLDAQFKHGQYNNIIEYGKINK